jgi:hypothetical protein
VTRLFVVVMREEEGLIMDGFTMDGRNSAAKRDRFDSLRRKTQQQRSPHSADRRGCGATVRCRAPCVGQLMRRCLYLHRASAFSSPI